METPEEFLARIGKAYKKDFSSKSKHIRFSSGILGLDIALGGGWPFNAISLTVGKESSGKTFTCDKAASMIANYCKTCRKSFNICKCATKIPCTTLMVDAEATRDDKWSTACGAKNVTTIVPETGEQAVDIIEDAIINKPFDLIILDSIAACVPSKEIESSAEDANVAAQARLMNKAFRKWNAALCKHAGDKSGPAIICINQLREKMILYGDNRTFPGGLGQRYGASIIIFTASPKIEAKTDADSTVGVFGGVTFKNKTATPKQEYAYDLYFGPSEDGIYGKGDVNNFHTLYSRAKKMEFIQKEAGQWVFKNGDTILLSGRTEDEFVQQLAANKDKYLLLYRSVIKQACGEYFI